MVDVHIENLIKRYSGHTAIDNIDLNIPSGAFVTLLGPSGCGKTTTLRSIAGLEQPDEGSIVVGERSLFDGKRGVFVPPERRNLGMVFQSYALWPHMTVAQNVAYPLRRQKWASSNIEKEVARLLEMVNLGAQSSRSVAALSGGQQQRVALARAMVGKPVMTLFDEPLSNLDVKLRDRMRAEIRRLHDQIGMTSVYVTHDQKEAFALSDLIVVMNEGKVQQAATPQELYRRPANAFVADFVGFENSFEAVITEGRAGNVRVRFPSGVEIEATGVSGSSGDAVTVFSRSKHLRLTGGQKMSKVVDGEIRAVTYFGDAYEFEVGTDLGLLRVHEPVDGQEFLPYKVGNRVTVYMDHLSAALLPSVRNQASDKGLKAPSLARG